MSDVCVAIIDDGICPEEMGKFSLTSYRVNNGSVIPDSEPVPRDSHGTICAKIVSKYCNAISFISVRILDQSGTASANDLITALEWCLDKDIQIVNLSNGIELASLNDSLYSICLALVQRHIIIVSAQSNFGRETLPASYPFVISVEQIRAVQTRNPLRNSNLYTSGRHRIMLNGEIHCTKRCNSFACAFASAVIANTFTHSRYVNIDFPFVFQKPFLRSYRIGACTIPFFLHPQSTEKQIGLSVFLTPCLSPLQNLGQIKCIFVEDAKAKAKQEFDYIKSNYRTINAVVWYGKMSFMKKIFCRLHRIRFVDFSEMKGRKYRGTIRYDIPTVQVTPLQSQCSAFEFVKELSIAFQCEKYSVFTVSDIPLGTFYGFAYTKEKRLASTIEHLCRIVDPDIVFIISFTKHKEADINFSLSGDVIRVEGTTLSLSSASDAKEFIISFFRN